MADSAGIGHVTQSLEGALRAAVSNSGPFSGTVIDLRCPTEIDTPAAGAMTLSLWLYRVRRFDDMENRPPSVDANGRLVPAPLPLVLHYLLTPFAAGELARQRLLGHAMQAMHAQAQLGTEFTRAALLGPLDSAIGIHLEQQSFEEATRVWHALNEVYRLSVSYFVQYVPIEASRSFAQGSPVLDRSLRTAAIEEVL
ncbi:DUF4255 domain-containing protein [Alteraurantiacibacter aquimixticola]|uniref:DUF4255 domain-containing protein n=1 Tax=Alteraurantiacibacter aquimixticola TaxID=2489173 RepID=A0A4V4U8Y2_9SPHN|nr:DUF4255 domain-containing protein [Alteraurantiacibacter aquimixticola]TIX49640.1 DUF4255 domain-containing protein [Alteraurantiacibacter aquimixticola]